MEERRADVADDAASDDLAREVNALLDKTVL
jgi:hypothetical protein